MQQTGHGRFCIVARRSNRAGTAFGAPVTAPRPPGGIVNGTVNLSAQGDRVDVLAVLAAVGTGARRLLAHPGLTSWRSVARRSRSARGPSPCPTLASDAPEHACALATFANDERCRARDASGGQRGCARPRQNRGTSARRFASALLTPDGHTWRPPRASTRRPSPRLDRLARRRRVARGRCSRYNPTLRRSPCGGRTQWRRVPVWEITAAVETLSRTWRRAAPGIPDRGRKDEEARRPDPLAGTCCARDRGNRPDGGGRVRGGSVYGHTAANLGQASSVVGGLSGSVGNAGRATTKPKRGLGSVPRRRAGKPGVRSLQQPRSA